MQVVVAVVVDQDMPLLIPVVEGDAGIETLAELILEMLDVGRRFLGGLAAPPALAGLATAGEMGCDELLGITHGGRAADQFLRDQDLLIVSLEGQQDLGVPRTEASLRQVVLHLGCEFQKAHGIGYGRAAFADASADLFLGETEFLGKPRVGGGLFDGIEPLALEILDEGQFQDLLIACLADDDGGFCQADLERGTQAAFASDQLVLPGDEPDDQRLDDATLTDRVNEFTELLLAELGTGLKRAGNDPVEGDLLDTLPLLDDGGRSGDAGVDERAETLAKALAEAAAKSFRGLRAAGFTCLWFRHRAEINPNSEVEKSDLSGVGNDL